MSCLFLIQCIANPEDKGLGLGNMLPVEGVKKQLDIAIPAAGFILFHQTYEGAGLPGGNRTELRKSRKCIEVVHFHSAAQP